MKTIENERLKLTTGPEGGMMFSLIDKASGNELLYQGDQGWSGRNPSLFPMVGSTWKNGEYEIDGKTYKMKNHGLVRYATLEEEEHDGKITYRLTSNKETLKQYPFDFDYSITYSLDGNQVKIDYDIKNTGNRPMPFSFGLHPGFKTAMKEGEAFEDFAIEFSPKSEGEQIVFFADKSPVEIRPVTMDEWKLNRKDLAEHDTMVYQNFKADKATLKYKDEPRLAVHFKGYPYLALWSCSTPSDYVCIEPWYGHADFEKVDVPFEKREGTIILEPDEEFKPSYSIEVL